LCWQIPDPTHVLQVLLRTLHSQMLAPPYGQQVFLLLIQQLINDCLPTVCLPVSPKPWYCLSESLLPVSVSPNPCLSPYCLSLYHLTQLPHSWESPSLPVHRHGTLHPGHNVKVFVNHDSHDCLKCFVIVIIILFLLLKILRREGLLPLAPLVRP
jgi:hypothetical protein